MSACAAEIAHSGAGTGFQVISDVGYRSPVFAEVQRIEGGAEFETKIEESEEAEVVIEIEEGAV